MIASGALVAGTIAVLATLLLSRESPNVRRGKELLSIGEFAAAIVEFKIAAKDNPDDQEAKPLLLYGVAKASDELAQLFESISQFDLASGAQLPIGVDPDVHEEIVRSVKKVRMELYERGLDTKDPNELAGLLRAAAAWIFKELAGQPASKKDVDYAALVLGMDGDLPAINYLCERLKSEKAEHVPRLLEAVGKPAIKPLRSVVQDRENLGRPKALSVLPGLLARDAAATMFTSSPTLRGLAFTDLPENLQMRELRSFLAERFVGGLTRLFVTRGVRTGARTSAKLQLHSLWAALDPDQERGVLLLQGFDTDRALVSVRMFLFEGGDYKPAQLQYDGKPRPALDGPTPIVRIRTSREGRLELVRPEFGEVAEERQVRRSKFHTGERVAIANLGSRGVVAGYDEYGLVRVRLDQPVDGTTELQVVPAVLRAIEMKKVQRAGYRLLMARIRSGDAVDFDTDSPLVDTFPPESALVGGETLVGRSIEQ